MSLSKKQQEFDVIKWKKSQELGIDACGTFDFCYLCNKSEENPCHQAYDRYIAEFLPKSTRQQSKKEFVKKGKKRQYRATIVDDKK